MTEHRQKSGFCPTHVLAYEENDVMKELLVRRETAELLTEDDWVAGAVPDWTIEDDGRIYYCGVDYAEERGVCTLRVYRRRPVDLDMLCAILLRGQRQVGAVAHIMGRSVEEVETALGALERLGRVVRVDGLASPNFQRGEYTTDLEG